MMCRLLIKCRVLIYVLYARRLADAFNGFYRYKRKRTETTRRRVRVKASSSFYIQRRTYLYVYTTYCKVRFIRVWLGKVPLGPPLGENVK